MSVKTKKREPRPKKVGAPKAPPPEHIGSYPAVLGPVERAPEGVAVVTVTAKS